MVWSSCVSVLFLQPFSKTRETKQLTKCILSLQKKMRKDAFSKKLSVLQQNLLGSCVDTLQRLLIGQVQTSKHSEGA